MSMMLKYDRACIVVDLLFIGFFYVYKNVNISNFHNNQSILDGCYHVYLDVRSNIGIQVRKLIELERYPNAKVLPIFDKVLGTTDHRKKKGHVNGKRICVIGFEPNPKHTEYLNEIEENYNNCGYKVKFFTETAVSGFNGKAMYYSDENFKKLEWGGGLLSADLSNKSKKPQKTTSNISATRLSDFLKNTVGKRKIPTYIDENHPPKVLMKIDIEGSEIEVISDNIFTGDSPYVNRFMIE